MFDIETEHAIYEMNFVHAQFNITTRCNMRCEHCRGAYTGAIDMSLSTIQNLIEFTRRNLEEDGGYLISGGEPLLHPDFKRILILLRSKIKKNNFVSITSNGYFLNQDIITFLQDLQFPDLRISISLDSHKKTEHDSFRQCDGAFDKALEAIKIVAKANDIRSIVRATVTKEQIANVPKIADIAMSLGADVLSVSSVIPTGRALGNIGLCLDSASKKKLIDLAKKLNQRDIVFKVDVNDPLAYIEGEPSEEEGYYGGCIAGIAAFSVEPTGDMHPCPLLTNHIITNVNDKNPKEIITAYQNSTCIQNLFDRNLRGKCGKCKYRFACGGCRARAEGLTGDYLGEDTDCWL